MQAKKLCQELTAHVTVTPQRGKRVAWVSRVVVRMGDILVGHRTFAGKVTEKYALGTLAREAGSWEQCHPGWGMARSVGAF